MTDVEKELEDLFSQIKKLELEMQMVQGKIGEVLRKITGKDDQFNMLDVVKGCRKLMVP